MDRKKNKKEKSKKEDQSTTTPPIPLPTMEKKPPPKYGKCPLLYKKNNDGKSTVYVNSPTVPGKDSQEAYKDMLCKVVGVGDYDLANDIFYSGSTNIQSGDVTERNNVILQSLTDQKPQDAHEARLCVQAAALYSNGMRYLKAAVDVMDDGTFAKDHWNTIFINNATRLLNLHAKTVEALIKYRQRGEQRITVVHQSVNVENGGKAIVNTAVATGGGAQPKTNEVPHGKSGFNADMSSEVKTVGDAMPQLCHERQTYLPDSWREKHGCENSGRAAAAERGEHHARPTD